MLIALHDQMGGGLFLALSIMLGLALTFWGIPKATDLMVDCAGGLAGKYLGPRMRTLVINASTNNPEAFSMLASFSLKKLGGWANPLGSLLANIYLMMGVSIVWVLLRDIATGKKERAKELLKLLWKERKLVAIHGLVSVATFITGLAAMRLVMQGGNGEGEPVIGINVLWGALVLVLGIVIFIFFVEMLLKRQRPQLFDDMTADSFRESWLGFAGGTVGVIACCLVLNELFLAWSDLYSTTLTGVFGPLVFAWMHYFLGAFVTSIPEMTVAIRNYSRLTPADLNTALGSVSYSNMVNLAIALLGLGVWVGLALFGVGFTWT